MKTLFDDAAYAELQDRIAGLSASSQREWGKMSPSQAVEHCARALEVATGRTEMKQALIGKLIAWAVKKKYIGEAPMPKNSPTGPTLIVTEEPDFDTARLRLSELINDFYVRGESGADGRVHAFFGKLNGREWGELQYKHVDHHLKQFGV